MDMARETGLWEFSPVSPRLKAFEALVRADERNEILRMSGSQWFKSQARYDEAIRARGETK
jgi:hypothetical protein